MSGRRETGSLPNDTAPRRTRARVAETVVIGFRSEAPAIDIY
jgi:hypothetical protein